MSLLCKVLRTNFYQYHNGSQASQQELTEWYQMDHPYVTSAKGGLRKSLDLLTFSTVFMLT